MATTKDFIGDQALNYKPGPLTTFSASCQRLIAPQIVPGGRVQTGSKAIVTAVQGKTNFLEVSFEVTLTGRPGQPGQPDQNSDNVSFTATCVVGYEVEFNRDVDTELDQGVLQELITPLFFVASERCRTMVWAMGYPFAPRSNRMPSLADAESISVETEKEPATKKIAAKKQKKSAK